MEFFVKKVLEQVDNRAKVVAATKYFNTDEMRELHSHGINHFGENRVESFLEKIETLTDLDVTWHIIGTLQTKKAKKIINKIDYLHSLDTIKLATEIEKRRETPLKCFIQVNISDEESKHGLEINDVIPFIKEIMDFKNIVLVGFMGMAAYTNDEKIISNSFQKLIDLKKSVYNELQLDLKELSIGMSNDYMIALDHQSTFLRLGSVLYRKEVS